MREGIREEDKRMHLEKHVLLAGISRGKGLLKLSMLCYIFGSEVFPLRSSKPERPFPLIATRVGAYGALDNGAGHSVTPSTAEIYRSHHLPAKDRQMHGAQVLHARRSREERIFKPSDGEVIYIYRSVLTLGM